MGYGEGDGDGVPVRCEEGDVGGWAWVGTVDTDASRCCEPGCGRLWVFIKATAGLNDPPSLIIRARLQVVQLSHRVNASH